ncbi:MAG: 5'-nucleotidase, lipoprotein e(P4) family [Planctomycetota bacterium]
MKLYLAIVMTLLATPTLAQQIPVDVENDPRYNSVCWVQNSAEYRALTTQIYRMAFTQFCIGLKDPYWSADEIQLSEGNFEQKKPAVILDVDETVLDNSPYNARNIELNLKYTTESWTAWCQEEKAGPVPGAVEFVRAVEGLGAEIFYVTNRQDDVRQSTLNNLKKLGFPVKDNHLLTKNSKKGRGGDKLSRRALVCKDHRVVLLIGDNLSDLFSGMEDSNTEQRNQVAKRKVRMLGSRWIVLPNPVYGSWERALPDGKEALITKSGSDSGGKK